MLLERFNFLDLGTGLCCKYFYNRYFWWSFEERRQETGDRRQEVIGWGFRAHPIKYHHSWRRGGGLKPLLPSGRQKTPTA